ncbi:hypothetical protein TVNIR_3273 [Thioalkalivibrio nitratireducens DSM 14787]|uniref:Uncharacterized protein n=1 Tax=Thioalkalivibrio nitratireducens (strain DSM 14787 / UNIQEM 213 / ALEN2) TaxID=1255043 RepID=L0E138_THIND|nr:hypothetical protein TVNIR_3273 [Thioalkalivibrio nitratireducens DSM 14787]
MLPQDACIPGTQAFEVATITGHGDFLQGMDPGTRFERAYRMALSMGEDQP